MNRVMCKNGHFYDGEKYQECPHCADGVAPIAPSHFDVVHQNAVKQDDKKEKKEKKGLFKKKEVTRRCGRPGRLRGRTAQRCRQIR